jgi:hypothetical protein
VSAIFANGETIDLVDDDDVDLAYGRTPDRYLHLCIVIADDIRASTGRDFYISIVFANDHETKPISDFIFDAATLLMATKKAVLAASAAWADAEIKNRK